MVRLDRTISFRTYLVTTGLCHDCHTPSVAGPDGPAPDMKRALSGHPQDIPVKAPAVVSEPWVAATTATLTAWSGPWGVSFSANLTPDPDTGVLRDFTEEQFVRTLRTGRHQGQGREILPPMPWPWIGKMTDDDLKAIFASPADPRREEQGAGSDPAQAVMINRSRGRRTGRTPRRS